MRRLFGYVRNSAVGIFSRETLRKLYLHFTCSEPPAIPYYAACVLMFFGITTSIVLVAANMAATKLWSLVAANMAATKLWSFFGVPVDVGLLLFPVTYIVGDLSVEIYGEKLTNRMVLCSAFFALMIMGIFGFAKALPDYPGADNSAFYILSDELGRLFLASIAAFVASELTNNFVFAKIRHNTQSNNFYVRALVSSAVARVADETVYEVVAFYGKLPFQEFLVQLVFAFVVGMTIEALFSPITNFLAKHLPRILHYSDGKIIAS